MALGTHLFRGLRRRRRRAAYHEFNFSPSGQWASYAFSGYRQRDERHGRLPSRRKSSPGCRRPARTRGSIACRRCCRRWPPTATLQIGLRGHRSRRYVDGSHSYWALAASGALPDFHHRDGFTLELAPPPPLLPEGKPMPALQFGLDRLLKRPATAQAAARPPTGAARPPGVGQRRPDARARRPGALPDLRLSAAFGPQHGLRGDKQDNMVESPTSRSRCTTSRSSACTAPSDARRRR
jgi:hypothetical protein